MEKKLHKSYITDYNLLIVQDLWQAHYQILSIVLLKKYTELNVNTDRIIKYVKLVEINTKFASAFLNAQTLKIIYKIQMFMLQ